MLKHRKSVIYAGNERNDHLSDYNKLVDSNIVILDNDVTLFTLHYVECLSKRIQL